MQAINNEGNYLLPDSRLEIEKVLSFKVDGLVATENYGRVAVF